MGSIIEGNKSCGDISSESSGVIENCYKDVNVSLNGAGKVSYATEMSRSQLSNSNFYSLTLGWDSSVWKYTNLNIDNGKYPTLNQK